MKNSLHEKLKFKYVYKSKSKNVLTPVYIQPFMAGSANLAQIIEQLGAGQNLLSEEINCLYFPFYTDERQTYFCQLDLSKAKMNGIDKIKVSIYNLKYAENIICFVNDADWSEIGNTDDLIRGLSANYCYTEEQIQYLTEGILHSRVKRLEDYTISQVAMIFDYL